MYSSYQHDTRRGWNHPQARERVLIRLFFPRPSDLYRVISSAYRTIDPTPPHLRPDVRGSEAPPPSVIPRVLVFLRFLSVSGLACAGRTCEDVCASPLRTQRPPPVKTTPVTSAISSYGLYNHKLVISSTAFSHPKFLTPRAISFLAL